MNFGPPHFVDLGHRADLNDRWTDGLIGCTLAHADTPSVVARRSLRITVAVYVFSIVGKCGEILKRVCRSGGGWVTANARSAAGAMQSL